MVARRSAKHLEALAKKGLARALSERNAARSDLDLKEPVDESRFDYRNPGQAEALTGRACRATSRAVKIS
jgi:hypothetical protein